MRRGPLALTVALVAGAVTLGGAVVATVAPSQAATSAEPTASAPAAEWGNAFRVPVDISAISCPAAGDCVAAGTENVKTGVYGAQEGFVIEESAGKWGNPTPIPGLAALNVGDQAQIDSISCSSPGNCSAGGNYAITPLIYPGVIETQAFVVTETAGVWGPAEEVPGSGAANSANGIALVDSVSCAAPGDCAAVGNIDPSSTAHMFVVNEADGVWGSLEPISGTTDTADDLISSVSCAAPGDCLAGGGSPDAVSHAFLVQEADGTWGSAQPVTGLASLPGGSGGSLVRAVSCPATGDCTATGDFGTSEEFVVGESAGIWADAQAITGLSGEYAGTDELACPSAGACALAGAIYSTGPFPAPSPLPYVASEADGSWGASEEVPGLPPLSYLGALVNGVSCAAPGDCSVAGEYYPSSGKWVPFVADETDGTWGTAQPVAGAAQLQMQALSCSSPLSCVAGGDGFLVEKSTARRTTLTLSVARASVSYGGEQTEKVSVAVTADAGTPPGTVVVRAGSGTLCDITLVGGHGGCAVSSRRFAPGKVVLGATYGGAPGFTASLPATATFTVVQDVTKSALRMSAGTVTFGRESAERLTAAVTPFFAGPAPGRVTVTAGSHVLCVISLHAGSGSCTLRPRQLAAGTYSLTARYAGTALYAPSTSATHRLTVRK
jgi:hypothetical protein